ncbi:hypothetical protein JL09_g5481 [Pichia kudriavzevii]|uniref:Uncharacterized protein n=1 Tax=Pichia kudriavzevii TaxID=4909 RepID=A0A099NTQ6_PICKU|nr:hypothetical protein JL09_g5481 [Pichia kudriavzevii]
MRKLKVNLTVWKCYFKIIVVNSSNGETM